MRITLQITCDNEAEAQTIIRKITAPPTWVDELEKTNPAPAKHAYSNGVALTESRIDKIMGSSGANLAEQSSSGSKAADAPRPNGSPGNPSIVKIGSETKASLLATLAEGKQPNLTKFSEHLKLLWQRGEVKFDDRLGKMEYYL